MIQDTALFCTFQNQANRQRPPQTTVTALKANFVNFVNEFTRQNLRTYQLQFQSNAEHRHHYLNISLSDMKTFDQQLFEKFVASPVAHLAGFEEALTEYAREHLRENGEAKWQVMMRSDQNARRLREIGNSLVGKLFVIHGIIVSCTKPYIKATVLHIQCRSCKHIKHLTLMPGENPVIPKKCTAASDGKCDPAPFVVMPAGEMIDAQRMKIQENPEDIPTGQIPRTTPLVATGSNVDRCVPGDKVRVTGIMMVQDTRDRQLGSSYIYVVGIEKIKERMSVNYTQQEEEHFKKMSKDATIENKIFKSIAPGIYGSEEIKKAIACMLFGGSRKRLPDGTALRGDINILLIGDPSTAKSQFLKFVQQAASISIYTSGKGSSAAGLTASIMKDNSTGEFQIEGGALVLADGGIVCIDEFDKMEPGDRVALHQAMEQQTISVAKAGITTRLNSRTSVLAAANPSFGRWSDDYKDISEQTELRSTILSRFDCIFVVRDLNTKQNNERIANHILHLHQGRPATTKQEDPDFPFETFKKYIRYARNKCFPRLNQQACEKLRDLYVEDRQISNKKATNNTSIPITVRQLEAIIRLSESLAKMRLQDEVTTAHVDQAHRLFEVSTLKAIEGKQLGIELPQALANEVLKIQQIIKKKVCISHQVSIARLIEQLDSFSPKLVQHAIYSLVKNGDFRQIANRKQLIRER